ncbi:MAG: tyrosine recombinase [Alphaproteobacteria bacterium CG11_big_fil_rev_8_21_14_0_20_44_7]|nr:MAG: tyrosine recombinase [Alphaproteobacteria bacterium CG11_big_fil_rev_8_21_14_0_20_44_7]
MNNQLHIESFLEMMSVERGSSRNTIEAYQRDLCEFAAGNKISVESCSADDIRKFLKSLSDSGLSAKTRARKLSSLRQFFLYLYTEKIRKDNPTSDVEAPKTGKSLPKFMSAKDVETLLEATQEDLRLKLMLEILYATGLRVSELISLKKTCIHVENGEYYVFVKGKGSKERLVPLGSFAIAALHEYLDNNDIEYWLFPSGKSHITRQRFGQMLKELALKSNLNPAQVSPHVIRHSFASHMLHNGADLRLVQELLGHEQIATTEIYTHIQAEKLQEIVSKFHPLSKKSG